MIRKPLVRLVLATATILGGLALAAPDADAMTPPDRTVPICKSEDGSYLGKHGHVRYQRVCVWDARRLGNRHGHSFLLVQGPRGQHPVYFRISHRAAKDLTR
jgi:hypothetical protein